MYLYSTFHKVLDILLELYCYIITLPIIDTPLSSRIIDNPKYTPYFDNYISTLDSIYIATYILTTEQARYRNRKGILSQNILAVYDFNIQFVYILAG